MNHKKTLLIVLSTCFVPVVLYLPFRLIAQQTNIVTYKNFSGPSPIDGVFVNRLAMFVWPTYMLLTGFVMQAIFATCRTRWFVAIVVALVIAFLGMVIIDNVPSLDEMLGIPYGGLNGFNSAEIFQYTISESKKSVDACPFAYLAGALFGGFVGRVWFRKGVKEEFQR